MPCIADLHLHSRDSRAMSREMEAESLATWPRTHPTHFVELLGKLVPADQTCTDSLPLSQPGQMLLL